MDYKLRLTSLKFSLMYWLELHDVFFFVFFRCLKDEEDSMNIRQYVTFAKTNTRFG